MLQTFLPSKHCKQIQSLKKNYFSLTVSFMTTVSENRGTVQKLVVC